MDQGTRLSAGLSFSCALRGEGEVHCWGSNTHGQLGGGSMKLRPKPAPVAGISDAVQIASSSHVSCATLQSGAVACWGSAPKGYGYSRDESYHPIAAGARQVTGIEDAARVELGSSELCAIPSDSGDIVCRSLHDQNARPEPIPNSRGLRQLRLPRFGVPHAEVLCGSQQACLRQLRMCGVWSDGKARCLADARTPPVTAGQGGAAQPQVWFELPVQDVVDLQLAGGHVCALTASGSAYCWGARDSLFPDAPSLTPAHFPPNLFKKPFSDGVLLTMGGDAGCALRNSGHLTCWYVREGPDYLQACTLSRCPEGFRLFDVKPAGQVVEVAAGWNHACALMDDDEIYCWGGNESGQLGIGTTRDSIEWDTSPRRVVFVSPPTP